MTVSPTQGGFVPRHAESPWPTHPLPESICVGDLVLILGAQGVMGKSSYRGHLKNIYGVSMYMFTCL